MDAELHVDAAEVRRRLDWLELTDDDRRRLEAVHPMVETELERILDRFYAVLLSHPESRAMLERPGVLERLRISQRRYFRQLTSGPYDEAYCEGRLRIGLVHHQVGVDPDLYLAAYSHYLRLVGEVLHARLADRPTDAAAALSALSKVVYLDMGLTLEAYFLEARRELAKRNAALERVNAELERARAAKERLAHMVVHDLKSPLAAVIAALDLLRARSDGRTALERRVIDQALDRCEELDAMIHNLIDVHRAETGRLLAVLEVVELSEVVSERVEALRLSASHAGRPLEIDSSGTVSVRADRRLLVRVLDNLLRNAIRHTPRGTRVTAALASRPDGGARLTVADDGPGIPAEVASRLFDPDASPELSHSGVRVDSGLGLPFCRLATEAMGASIAVHSRPENGTVFVVDFPPGAVAPAG